MWQLGEPWWQLVVRGSVVYLVLFVLFRLSGKRQAGQMTPFDLLLLLIISNAVQNAMIGQDSSLLGGLLVALVLLGWSHLLGWLSNRSRRLERLLEGRPEVLIHNGKIFDDILQRNQISQEDLLAALRRQGVFSVADVAFAVLETNGGISVKKRSDG
ncbi:uncharacterized protein DUF421 [Tahibacter aquaticus]|uniref:Uncharacterized protein DUF421 n=1 Tax=Tahibacter aquaticus TaxID=520092 RepID=A0A4R6YS88_9GAMM|nr:YetF domain-containing protein [Tahibacter aquaticus]TDR40863.1 uncharacterized protein DUF421 [Tahibacter aquaticus]